MEEKACSMGLKSGEYGGRNMSLHTESPSSGSVQEMGNKIRTGLIFDKNTDLFGMVNTAIVEYEDTPWARVSISEWDLLLVSTFG